MFKNKKIPYLHFLPIIFLSLLMYKLLDTPVVISSSFRYVASILSYLIWGFVIAILLNPLLSFIENKFKLNRVVSLCITYALFLSIITFAVIIFFPILANNLSSLINNFDAYKMESERWLNKTMVNIQSNANFDLISYNILNYIENNISTLISSLNKYIEITFNFLVRKTVLFTTTIIKFVFGLLISIYILKDKNSLLKFTEKLITAYWSEKTSKFTLNLINKIYTAFTLFITGKFLASLIIGVICFIGLSIFKIPYALILTIIIVITNMVPYIGPAFGMIPAIIVAFFISPIKALWIFLFLMGSQQIDAWYLSPKIIGDQVGLSPLLIISSIVIGGSLYGIVGILLAIPLTSVLKDILNASIEKRLSLKTTIEE